MSAQRSAKLKPSPPRESRISRPRPTASCALRTAQDHQGRGNREMPSRVVALEHRGRAQQQQPRRPLIVRLDLLPDLVQCRLVANEIGIVQGHAQPEKERRGPHLRRKLPRGRGGTANVVCRQFVVGPPDRGAGILGTDGQLLVLAGRLHDGPQHVPRAVNHFGAWAARRRGRGRRRTERLDRRCQHRVVRNGLRQDHVRPPHRVLRVG